MLGARADKKDRVNPREGTQAMEKDTMHPLKERIRVIVSVGVSFVLVTLLIQSYRHQRDTDQRLTEIQKVLQDVSAIRAQGSRGPSTPVILDGGSIGSEAALKQHNLDEILAVGWKLVDSRSPDQAAEAVTVFNQGIAHVDSSSPDLFNGLGRALLVAGKPRDAIAAWRKGLALAPNFSEMQSGVGWAYWWLNDPYRAKKAWERALAINPDSVDAWSAIAWIDLALAKHAEAKRGFQELVKFDAGRKSWVIGLSMTQARNTDVREIAQFFPLPPLAKFEQPLPIDPARSSP
jgi:tetratricopeptide (TPR) repeat protein